jgi:hypothetical protein
MDFPEVGCSGDMSDWKCTDSLGLLGKIAEVVISSDDLPTVSRLVVDLTVEFMDAGSGALLLVDSRNELVILGARGMAREQTMDWRGLPAASLPARCR